MFMKGDKLIHEISAGKYLKLAAIDAK